VGLKYLHEEKEYGERKWRRESFYVIMPGPVTPQFSLIIL